MDIHFEILSTWLHDWKFSQYSVGGGIGRNSSHSIYTSVLQCNFITLPIKRWGLFLYLIWAGLVTCLDQQNVKEVTLWEFQSLELRRLCNFQSYLLGILRPPKFQAIPWRMRGHMERMKALQPRASTNWQLSKTLLDIPATADSPCLQPHLWAQEKPVQPPSKSTESKIVSRRLRPLNFEVICNEAIDN